MHKNTPTAKGLAHRREAGAAVLVTGAGGGIGGGITERLLRDGWHVLALDRDAQALGTLADQMARDTLRCITLDLSRRDDILALAETLRGEGVALAGLVNAAGLLQDVESLATMDDAAHRLIWEVNYFAAVTCVQEFGTMIGAGGGGSIVNITSINEHRPLPLHAYAPSKVAMGAMNSLAAGELGRAGVRVNAIAPGFTLTPILEQKIKDGKRDMTAIKAATPLGRLVEISEIAAVTSFLMSDESSAVSGASIPVDAGWTASAHWMKFGDLL